MITLFVISACKRRNLSIIMVRKQMYSLEEAIDFVTSGAEGGTVGLQEEVVEMQQAGVDGGCLQEEVVEMQQAGVEGGTVFEWPGMFKNKALESVEKDVDKSENWFCENEDELDLQIPLDMCKEALAMIGKVNDIFLPASNFVTASNEGMSTVIRQEEVDIGSDAAEEVKNVRQKYVTKIESSHITNFIVPHKDIRDDSSSSSSDAESNGYDREDDYNPSNVSTGISSDDEGRETTLESDKENATVKKGTKSSKRRKSMNEKGKYPMLAPCKCRFKCFDKVNEAQRKAIHKAFWAIDSYDQRKAWMFAMISSQRKSSDTLVSKDRIKERNYSRSYKFHIDNRDVKVCSVMFRHTLGYKYDTVITKMFTPMNAESIRPSTDKRGKHRPKHAFSAATLDLIDGHIESFNPTVSHYRRAHAPLRRYLAPELTKREMWKYFKESNPDVKCSERAYAKRVSKKKISFCKLGEEECEVCDIFEVHECAAGLGEELQKGVKGRSKEIMAMVIPEACKECDEWVIHMNKAIRSRKEYRNDADMYPVEHSQFLSADMQKVQMLPRLPGVKTAVFTRRITVYHETFAPLIPAKEIKQQWKAEKKKFKAQKPIGLIWHEGIAGRNDEDVISSLVKCLFLNRFDTAQSVTIWADNCTGQLKNWTLYGAMVNMVNVHETITEITIKYFEKGHTYMSADSFHHQVELASRALKRLYDFEDFSSAVSKTGIAVHMNADDFLDFENHLSSAKDTHYPYIKDISVVQFRAGSTKLFWKESFNDEDYQSGEFMMKKHRSTTSTNLPVRCKTGPRGVTSSKLNDIISKIGPIIPVSKRRFWENLPTNDNSKDLTINYDHLAPQDKDKMVTSQASKSKAYTRHAARHVES